MTDRDEVTELADRLQAKRRRGEDPDGLEFATDFASLTDDERERFLVLLDLRTAHAEEKLEGLEENVRFLLRIADLISSSGAPPGTTLGQARVAGYVSVLEVVDSIRAVPDPLAGQQPD